MFNIQNLINDVIEQSSGYNTSLRDGTKFHVSDAGGCYRARIYKRMGIEPTRKIEISALRKMTAGSAGHEKLQGLLRRYGKLYLSEGTVETEHVKGHSDGIIKNGVLSLLEIKTIEKWSMGWIQKTGAKREHILQMKTYWVLHRDDLKNLDHAVLSYVKREDFQTKDFYFKWSDEIAKDVEQEWRPLIKHWLDKTLPECTCPSMYDGAGPKYCRYSIDDKNCCDEKLFKEVKNEN